MDTTLLANVRRACLGATEPMCEEAEAAILARRSNFPIQVLTTYYLLLTTYHLLLTTYYSLLEQLPNPAHARRGPWTAAGHAGAAVNAIRYAVMRLEMATP